MNTDQVILSAMLCLFLAGCESDITNRPNNEPTASTDKPDIPQTQTASLLDSSSIPPVSARFSDSISHSVSQPLVAPRPWRLLIPEKQFALMPGTNTLSVSFSDLSLERILAMRHIPSDAFEHFPEWLRQLEGKRVRISGFMYPPFQEKDLDSFVLVPDVQLMNFGVAIRVDEAISVRLQKNTTINYQVNREFDVEGVFRIVPLFEDGEWCELYQLNEARVILD